MFGFLGRIEVGDSESAAYLALFGNHVLELFTGFSS